MSQSKRFLVTIMKWRISGQGYKHLTRFSSIVLFKPAASTMQKINPVGCFGLTVVFVTEGFLIYIYICIYIYFLLFEQNRQNRISKELEKKFLQRFRSFFVK